MGFPLSRFQQLSELGNGYMKQSFEQFKLTAIVLHEHNDYSFKDKMQQLFERLDKLTGEDFLFVTFITPPPSWSRYGDNFNRLSKLNLSAEGGMDDIVVLSKLKRAFGLEYANLPVILLTDNISGRDFIWFQTSAEQIEDHLLEIARFCDQQEQRPKLTDDAVKALLKKMGGGKKASIDAPLNAIICDVDAERGGCGLGTEKGPWAEIRLMWLHAKMGLAMKLLKSCGEEVQKTGQVNEDTIRIYDDAILRITDCLPALSSVGSIDKSSSTPSLRNKRKRYPLGANP